jgi:hypothetical protein
VMLLKINADSYDLDVFKILRWILRSNSSNVFACESAFCGCLEHRALCLAYHVAFPQDDVTRLVGTIFFSWHFYRLFCVVIPPAHTHTCHLRPCFDYGVDVVWFSVLKSGMYKVH